MERLTTFHVLAGLLVVLTISFAGDRVEAEETVEDEPLIVVGYPEQGSPFLAVSGRAHLPTSDPDRYTGIDMEVARRVASRLGRPLVFKIPDVFDISHVIDAVSEGRADIALGALTITPERQRLVDFSRPYYRSHPVVFVRAGSPIRTLDDLKGHRGAVNIGSSLEEHLRRMGFGDDDLYLTGFAIENVTAVEEGKADFGLDDADLTKTLMDSTRTVEVAFPWPTADEFGFAVRQGDAEMLAVINSVLAEMEASSELESLLATYQEGR